MASDHAGCNQVGGAQDLHACGEIIMAIDPDIICSELLSLNEQSYSHDPQSIAVAGSGDYLQSTSNVNGRLKDSGHRQGK